MFRNWSLVSRASPLPHGEGSGLVNALTDVCNRVLLAVHHSGCRFLSHDQLPRNHARCYKISSSCQLWMKLSSPRWPSKKPSGAKLRWVKLLRVPPKRWDTIHWNFITSRHFRINRGLCKRLHSKVTGAVQRVHQTLPSPCGSGLAHETNWSHGTVPHVSELIYPFTYCCKQLKEAEELVQSISA